MPNLSRLIVTYVISTTGIVTNKIKIRKDSFRSRLVGRIRIKNIPKTVAKKYTPESPRYTLAGFQLKRKKPRDIPISEIPRI